MTDRSQRENVGRGFILLAVFAASLSCSGENWKQAGENVAGAFFYDTSSVRPVEPGVLSVRTKMVFTEYAATRFAEEMPEAAALHYSIDVDVIDCGNNQYFVSRVVYYDKQGKVLYDPGEDKGGCTPDRWRPIPEETAIHSISREVCRAEKKPGAP